MIVILVTDNNKEMAFFLFLLIADEHTCLNVLYSYGWRCILMSEQLSEYRVSTHSRIVASDERVEYIKHMLCAKCAHLYIGN
jgi:hypothetical protein